MLVQILTFIHNLTTMLFGIYISAFFLGVKQERKNIFTLFLLFAFEGIVYIVNFLLWGTEITDRLYAVIIHLPLILFLTLYYKYPFISSCISVFSAYLCCQLSNWIGLLALTLTGREWCYYTSRILTTVIFFFLLCRFVCRTTEAIFARDTREFYIIGFLPTIYYFFDYSFTKITNLLYSNNKIVIEFMGFVFCISYFGFLFVYFREYEKKQELKQYSDLMKMQLLSIEKEIEQVKRSKEKLSILRHDMRHHLNIILSQLQNNNTKKATEYIEEIGNQYDDTIIAAYCHNEMINAVISIYHARFSDKQITFHCDISIGETLPCPDTAICTILSNALENSMHALEEMTTEKKWANLTISEKNNHLLLQIENPIVRIPKFVNGIPTSGKKGHGIGVKSIIYYVEQLNGQCHFSLTDHTFILRIII
ncbi:MAG: GHKL domain-containing protein [Lachnospiraceae bacterium]|nr:GHKL domain-containing protein [Lachnospiraceae bacterium]